MGPFGPVRSSQQGWGVGEWHARQTATPSGGGMVPHARATAGRGQARDEGGSRSTGVEQASGDNT